MRLLLDTHAVLWLLDGSLPSASIDLIRSRDSDVAISAASIWEIAIKQKVGKLEMTDRPIGDLIPAARRLDITFEQAAHAGALPLHHTDPFDRMLVAQAQLDGRSIVTNDSELSRYDVHVVPAR